MYTNYVQFIEIAMKSILKNIVHPALIALVCVSMCLFSYVLIRGGTMKGGRGDTHRKYVPLEGEDPKLYNEKLRLMGVLRMMEWTNTPPVQDGVESYEYIVQPSYRSGEADTPTQLERNNQQRVNRGIVKHTNIQLANVIKLIEQRDTLISGE